MSLQSLGIIGLGAFGRFMAKHLAPHFALTGYDPFLSDDLRQEFQGAWAKDLKDIAACDFIVIAVPVQKMEATLCDLAPLVRPGTLVLDVGSVKIKPAELMQQYLPDNVDLVGTHPLFGPQSGKNGIAGLNMVVANIRGSRGACVAAFLRDTLQLKVHEVTPTDHDRELAYVQGLTHLLGKVIVAMDLPEFRLTTRTYDYLQQMVDMIRYDSDELFKAIERENPFSAEAKKSFFTAARNLEERLMKD